MNKQKIITHILTISGIIVGIFLLYTGIRESFFGKIFVGLLFILIPSIILLGWHSIFGKAHIPDFVFAILFGGSSIFFGGGALYFLIHFRFAYKDSPVIWFFALIPILMILAGIYAVAKPFFENNKKK